MGYTKQQRPLWNQYRNIIQTNYYTTCPEYDKYGHLGTHWGPGQYKQFEKYILTHLGPQPTVDHKLARKDQTKGWYPGNLEWIEPKELSNKMIDNCRWITYKRKTQSMKQWSEELGISYWTIYNRLEKGWPTKLVLSTKKFRSGDVKL